METDTDYLTQHRDGGPVFDDDEMSEPSSQPHRTEPEPRSQPPRLGRWLFVSILVLVAALVFGFVPRLRQRAAVAADTRELAIPNVLTVCPAPGQVAGSLTLSGELKPLAEAAIY